MATFDHTLTEADIGAILDPANGFVVSLSQTAPSTDRGDPQWSASLLRWKTGYLALRGEGDTQAIYCCPLRRLDAVVGGRHQNFDRQRQPSISRSAGRPMRAKGRDLSIDA